MVTWLSDATHMRAGTDLSLLTPPGTHWARRSVRVILAEITECG